MIIKLTHEFLKLPLQKEGTIEIKQADECIVQASDGIPRKISNCSYEEGETISITYKLGQPNIESHHPAGS
jgi:hypothetical protein